MAAFETQQKDRMSADYTGKGAIQLIPRIRHIRRTRHIRLGHRILPLLREFLI
jgi:hypothetical protein